MRSVVVLVLGLAAGCGSPSGHSGGDDGGADATAGSDAARPRDAAVTHDAAMLDATAHDAAPDAFPGVLDVRIQCRNDCVLVAHPASISVSAGTEFRVNWINTGDTECDVAKIDQANHVPIVLGLQPGTSYDDTVHPWCGTLFTGTFEFRISICTVPSYIPVDCGA